MEWGAQMKQVIVVNTALQMPCGKLAAQVAHASVAALLVAERIAVERWLSEGMPKIVLEAADSAELLTLYEQARAKLLPAQIIQDAGKTVLEPGTITCLGMGPASVDSIDAVTGKLRLLR